MDRALKKIHFAGKDLHYINTEKCTSSEMCIMPVKEIAEKFGTIGYIFYFHYFLLQFNLRMGSLSSEVI